jgi:hypothetical protein
MPSPSLPNFIRTYIGEPATRARPQFSAGVRIDE